MKQANYYVVLLCAIFCMGAYSYSNPICVNGDPVLATLRGFQTCPCVTNGKCTVYTAKSCSVLSTPAGSYCDDIDWGPGELDQCNNNGSDPTAQCQDPNQGAPIGCYKLRTGMCAVGLAMGIIPYQYCNYTAFNVDSGSGQVYNGPSCP
jgi:hypothetical protein